MSYRPPGCNIEPAQIALKGVTDFTVPDELSWPLREKRNLYTVTKYTWCRETPEVKLGKQTDTELPLYVALTAI